MITAQKIPGRRALATAALAVVALGATGCGAINDQATTDKYAPSDGVVFSAGDLEVRNLMLVTNSADEEARVLGSLVNDSDADTRVNLNVDGTAVSIAVPADSVTKLEDDANKTVIPSAGEEPGSHTLVDVTVNGESVEKSVPVVNGVLPEYRQYLPGGYEEGTVEHLEHEEEEHGGGH
ncbi:hypothetical protein [Zhihengliuella salsuginis]|uniref:DNA modification methylase n=1 Tax=Zhihengliuella salsuginis TaxID=578222 RepID=A0ABQ3GKM4_9MICC|nr:hypothetical protein [Zhihengliuella salsuginis]GHD12856.1 hypothetical protein GCM10008096_28560 [Zhihengliuella salsuginis]